MKRFRVRALISVEVEIEIEANSRVEAFTRAHDAEYAEVWKDALAHGTPAGLEIALIHAEPLP